ncbi:unnamed protein product [Lathyrus sativus]|nr:unnamed protein product [Lathyrus sativus]
MAEANGIVKHIVIGKFKDDITQERIDELIKGFANLVNLTPTMKSFHWGRDISTDNLHQGFTHVFESTFDSLEAVAEYVAHPAHVEYANLLLPCLDKVIIMDYKPTIVNL